MKKPEAHKRKPLGVGLNAELIIILPSRLIGWADQKSMFEPSSSWSSRVVHHTRNYYLDNDCGLSRCVVLSSKSLIGNYSLFLSLPRKKKYIYFVL